MNSGTTHLIIEDDFGLNHDEMHGLTTGSTAIEKWSIHPDDPLSARGECRWTQEQQRGTFHLRTETGCEMWSDSTKFFLHARINAYENEELVFSKTLEDSIPRNDM